MKLLYWVGLIWGLIWGVLAWIPLFIFCIMAAIAALDYKEFKNTLDDII